MGVADKSFFRRKNSFRRGFGELKSTGSEHSRRINGYRVPTKQMYRENQGSEPLISLSSRYSSASHSKSGGSTVTECQQNRCIEKTRGQSPSLLQILVNPDYIQSYQDYSLPCEVYPLSSETNIFYWKELLILCGRFSDIEQINPAG